MPAILTLAVVAILSAHQLVLAIAAWGARQSGEVLAQLGFPEGCTPCQSTMQRLLCRLDGRALAPAPAPGTAGVAIDGKAQRGRLP